MTESRSAGAVRGPAPHATTRPGFHETCSRTTAGAVSRRSRRRGPRSAASSGSTPRRPPVDAVEPIPRGRQTPVVGLRVREHLAALLPRERASRDDELLSLTKQALQRRAPPGPISTEHRELFGSGIAVGFGLDGDVELPVRYRGLRHGLSSAVAPTGSPRRAEHGDRHPSIRTWSPVDRSRGGHVRASKKNGQNVPAEGRRTPTPAAEQHPTSVVSAPTHSIVRGPGMEAGTGTRAQPSGKGTTASQARHQSPSAAHGRSTNTRQRVERSARRPTRVGFHGVALPLGFTPTLTRPRRGPPQPAGRYRPRPERTDDVPHRSRLRACTRGLARRQLTILHVHPARRVRARVSVSSASLHLEFA